MPARGRNLNDVVTGFWTLAAPLYDLPVLQQWVCQPAQDEVIAELRADGACTIADYRLWHRNSRRFGFSGSSAPTRCTGWTCPTACCVKRRPDPTR